MTGMTLGKKGFLENKNQVSSLKKNVSSKTHVRNYEHLDQLMSLQRPALSLFLGVPFVECLYAFITRGPWAARCGR